MLSLLNLRHPFFLPLWRRIAVTAVCLGWALFELISGAMFFAILFGALGVYTAREFFWTFDPANFDASNRNEDNRP